MFEATWLTASDTSRDELCVLRRKKSIIDWSVDGIVEKQKELYGKVHNITQG